MDRTISVRKQRYLAALGIERWVRRSLLPVQREASVPSAWQTGQAEPPSDQAQLAAARQMLDESLGAEPVTASDNEPSSIPESTSSSKDADRGLSGPDAGGDRADAFQQETEGAHHAAVAGAAADDPVEPDPGDVGQTVPPAADRRATAESREADAAPGGNARAPTTAGRRDSSARQEPPRFNLVMLELGSGILLVDEALLQIGALQSHQLQLLADILRTGVMLRAGPSGGEVQRRAFFWPQLEDSQVDQSLPRAQEALSYFLAQSRGSADAFVIRLLHNGAGSSATTGVAPNGAPSQAPSTAATVSSARPSASGGAHASDERGGEGSISGTSRGVASRSEPSSGAAQQVLQGMPDPGVLLLDLDARVLQDPEQRQAIWDRLQSLWRPTRND